MKIVGLSAITKANILNTYKVLFRWKEENIHIKDQMEIKKLDKRYGGKFAIICSKLGSMLNKSNTSKDNMSELGSASNVS
jgi:hypothetical protein